MGETGKAKAFLISIVVAALAVAGSAIGMRGTPLGLSAPKPSGIAPAALAASRSRLDRWSAELRKQRAAQPPALPALPRFAHVTIPHLTPMPVLVADTTATSAAPTARVGQRGPGRTAEPMREVKTDDRTTEPATTLAASPPAATTAGGSGGRSDDGHASDDPHSTDGHNGGGQGGDESSDDGPTGSDD